MYSKMNPTIEKISTGGILGTKILEEVFSSGRTKYSYVTEDGKQIYLPWKSRVRLGSQFQRSDTGQQVKVTGYEEIKLANNLDMVKALVKNARPNPIPGGIGDNLDPEDVDPKEFEIGMNVEKEHSPRPDIREDILLDHLQEDPFYYENHDLVNSSLKKKADTGGMQDVWKFETSDEDVAAESLNLSIEKAFEGDPNAIKFIEYIFEEPWESAKKKLETEGSGWYVWYMDGVHKYMQEMIENNKKYEESNPPIESSLKFSSTYANVEERDRAKQSDAMYNEPSKPIPTQTQIEELPLTERQKVSHIEKEDGGYFVTNESRTKKLNKKPKSKKDAKKMLQAIEINKAKHAYLQNVDELVGSLVKVTGLQNTASSDWGVDERSFQTRLLPLNNVRGRVRTITQAASNFESSLFDVSLDNGEVLSSIPGTFLKPLGMYVPIKSAEDIIIDTLVSEAMCKQAGTWEAPQTAEKATEMINYLNSLPDEVDLAAFKDSFWNMIGDDEFYDQIDAIQKDGPSTSKGVILSYVKNTLSKWLDRLQTEPESWSKPWDSEAVELLEDFILSTTSSLKFSDFDDDNDDEYAHELPEADERDLDELKSKVWEEISISNNRWSGIEKAIRKGGYDYRLTDEQIADIKSYVTYKLEVTNMVANSSLKTSWQQDKSKKEESLEDIVKKIVDSHAADEEQTRISDLVREVMNYRSRNHYKGAEDYTKTSEAVRTELSNRGWEIRRMSSLKFGADVSDQVPPMGWNSEENPSGAGPAKPPLDRLQQPDAADDPNVLYDSGKDTGQQFQTTINPKDKSVTVKFLDSPEKANLDNAVSQAPQQGQLPKLNTKPQPAQPGGTQPGQNAPSPEFTQQNIPAEF